MYVVMFLVPKQCRGFPCDSGPSSHGVGDKSAQGGELFVVSVLSVGFWLRCQSLVESSFLTLVWLTSRFPWVIGSPPPPGAPAALLTGGGGCGFPPRAPVLSGVSSDKFSFPVTSPIKG